MFMVATPRVLAIQVGRFEHGPPPRGFVTSVEEAHDHLGRYDTTTSEERLHRCRWVLRWRDIVELSAVEPWPSLRIAWKTESGGGDTRVLSPGRRWFGQEPTEEEKQWEQVFDALFAYTR